MMLASIRKAIWVLFPISIAVLTAGTTAIDSQGNVIAGFNGTFTLDSSGCFAFGFGSPLCVITKFNMFDVEKLSSDGTTQAWDNSLSGTGTALGVGPDGTVYVAGSLPLPVASPAGATAIASLDARSGFATNTFAFDGDVLQLLVDAQGEVIVCGSAPGSTLPLPKAVAGIGSRRRPYCAWLDSGLTHVESAVAIGGSQGETFTAAALDSLGSLFIAGTTTSVPRSATITAGIPYTPFPVTTGALDIAGGPQNAFVAKFGSARTLQYAAVIGSSGVDTLLSLAVDAAGNAYLSGQPGADDFPTPAGLGLPANSGVFAAKITPDGAHLLYAAGVAINAPYSALSSVDSNGNLRLVVRAPSSFSFGQAPNLVTTDPFESFTPTIGAATICASSPAYSSRAALIEFGPDGSTLLSSYLPYPNPSPLLLDTTGNVYVVGRVLPFDVFDPKTLARPTSLCVVNAADTVDGPLIPGEVIAVHGLGIGPSQPAPFQITNGVVPTSLAGLTLLIDGIPAPLLYVSANQINAVVPFEVLESNHSVTVQVVNEGVGLNTLNYLASGEALAIFTHDNSYGGQAIAFNQDGTSNTPSNPANAGSSVTLLVTGIGPGMNSPTPSDGSLGIGQMLSFPQLTIGALGTSGYENLAITSVTDDPGAVQGLDRVAVTIPQDAGMGQLVLYPNGFIYVH